MSLSVLNMDDFRDVIGRHDDSGQITLLRSMVTNNSDAIADYLLVGSTSSHIRSTTPAMPFGPYPGTDGITKQKFDSALVTTQTESVFTPWDGWWTGKWSDNSSQYHIWDRTVHDTSTAQWIQPVTQSTQGFGWKRTGQETGAGINVTDSDLAINVWSSKKGITGWVSKKSGVELPHVGYLINSNTLLWFTIYGADYFMFLEKIIEGGAKYSIYGRPFTIDNKTLVVNPGNIMSHNGTYESFKKLD